MGRFNNAYRSHEHSLEVLRLVRRFSDFLESVSSVADFGCGGGLDINWWATQQSYLSDPPKPYNYRCYAIDRDIKQLKVQLPSNVHVIQEDFEKKIILSNPVDIIWCHDAFQYCVNPLNTLRLFNEQLVENGMLYLCVPTHRYQYQGQMTSKSSAYQYFDYNLVHLIYMLSVNGFDCKDAYFLKETEDPWIHAVVYKSGVAPLDPRTTSWYDIAAQGLLNASMENCVRQHGFLVQDQLIFTWLDKDWHYARD